MESCKQNSYLTFKYNKSFGRHGWLRLTPAYSVKMVEHILKELDYIPTCVLEPFSGTGTTELVCANRGIPSFAYDINPFLVWLAKVKCSIYSPRIIKTFYKTAESIVQNVHTMPPSAYPPIYNIERWWPAKQLNYLARIKTSIKNVRNPQISDLLQIAFCRLVITLSNASFNHVSTSFANSKKDITEFSEDFGNNLFLSFCEMIVSTVKTQPQVQPCIDKQSAMFIPQQIREKYDTIITSPPYPNRISYIRELRPYMYWLDYIHSSSDASDMDWETVGGTWGSATSKLNSWNRKTNLLPNYLFDITDKIANSDNKSSKLMANYVLKYFDDMAQHVQSVYNTIMKGGTVHYIVGNSSFYNQTVPSDEIYKSILQKVGFREAKSVIVRKRNCNKALYEYWISARK